MHGFADIPVATTVRSGNSGRGPRRNPNGIDVLQARTNAHIIPGYQIPPDLMEELTATPQKVWLRRYETWENVSSRLLGNLTKVVFSVPEGFQWNGGYISGSVKDERKFHFDFGGMFNVDHGYVRKRAMALHVQGDTPDGQRDIYLAEPKWKIGESFYIPESLTPEGVAALLRHKHPNLPISAGTTIPGTGTVLGGRLGRTVGHLFRGQGDYYRWFSPLGEWKAPSATR
jgi:hypothetical protein